ncbi:hypothetical protein [Ochrobactrum sp. CGA5]|uniref:hypothetical protein n=1 Tax=Ochrobactrum sp. CGA5 TaxID=2583453 RepID=UPI00111F1169|nr:hypothetical protein [Ochrobactrum sp. CGA5]
MSPKLKRGRTIGDKLSRFRKIIRATGACRFYHNGDGAGLVWRWWHPVAWIWAPFSFLLLCVVAGVPEAIRCRHEIGFGMDPYFIKHPDKLIWESDE